MPNFSEHRKLPRHVDHIRKQVDSEEERGVVLEPLTGNAWDSFNKRRVKSCVDCHRSELTEAGTPDREEPLGKWTPKAGVMGSRAKAKYASREDVIRDLEGRKTKLPPHEAKALGSNIEALRRDKDKPSTREYSDPRAKQPGKQTKSRLADMLHGARDKARRGNRPIIPYAN